MKKTIIISVLLFLSSFIYACTEAAPIQESLDNEVYMSSEELAVDIPIQEYRAFDNDLQNRGLTAESNDFIYMVKGMEGLYVLDKMTHEYKPACKKPLCSHKSILCLSKKQVNCIKNYDGRIIITFYDDKARLYELNQDTYELSEFYSVDTDKELWYFDVYDGKLIICMSDVNGDGGWYLEDMETGARTELIDRIPIRFNIGIDNGKLFVSTTEMEMYSIDLSTYEKKKLCEGLGRDVAFGDGRLYFLRYDLDENSSMLYSINPDGSDERQLCANVFSFRICENKIFYVSDESRGEDACLYMIDLDGNGKKQIIKKLSKNYEQFVFPDMDMLVVFNNIDSVKKLDYYLISYDGNVVYSNND